VFGLVFDQGSILVDCALLPRIKQFSNLEAALTFYRGVVGRDVLLVQKAVAQQTAQGYPAVTFTVNSYVSPLSGNWDADWGASMNYVAYRDAKGVLHVLTAMSAAT
jgi:hypothetical protein